MTYDPLQEHIPLNSASSFFPGRPSYCTLWRWVSRGTNGVKLRVVKVGGKYFLTRNLIREFLDRCTIVVADNDIETRSKKADKQLDDLGV